MNNPTPESQFPDNEHSAQPEAPLAHLTGAVFTPQNLGLDQVSHTLSSSERISELAKGLSCLLRRLENVEHPSSQNRIVRELSDLVQQAQTCYEALKTQGVSVSRETLKIIAYSHLTAAGYLSERQRGTQKTEDHALYGLGLCSSAELLAPAPWKLWAQSSLVEYYTKSANYPKADQHLDQGLQDAQGYDRPYSVRASLLMLGSRLHEKNEHNDLAVKYAEACVAVFAEISLNEKNARRHISQRTAINQLDAQTHLANISLNNPKCSNLDYKELRRNVYQLNVDLFGEKSPGAFTAALDLLIARLGHGDFETSWNEARALREALTEEVSVLEEKKPKGKEKILYGDLLRLCAQAHVISGIAEYFYGNDSGAGTRAIDHIWSSHAYYMDLEGKVMNSNSDISGMCEDLAYLYQREGNSSSFDRLNSFVTQIRDKVFSKL